MSYIRVKSKKDLIKTLKKIGDDIVIVKEEAVYAFPRGMYEQIDFEKNKQNFKYYRITSFVKKIKVKK